MVNLELLNTDNSSYKENTTELINVSENTININTEFEFENTKNADLVFKYVNVDPKYLFDEQSLISLQINELSPLDFFNFREKVKFMVAMNKNVIEYQQTKPPKEITVEWYNNITSTFTEPDGYVIEQL